MAEISLADLRSALDAEGVQVDDEALTRAFRKLSTPHGCEHCGMHVKVGVVKSSERGYGIHTTCCNTLVTPMDEPKGRKRNG